MTKPGTIVATIAKNKREDVVVSLSEFKGYDLVDLRVWFRADAESEGKPTPKGLAMKVSLLPELVKALQAAEAQARNMGLLPSGEG